MDVYKLRTEDRGSRKIEQGSFEAETLKREPWYQRNSQGEEVQFAVCPACDNPIQIIGLYRIPKKVILPFGKHSTHGVAGLAPLVPEERDHCPYFKPRPREKTERKAAMSPLSRKILELLSPGR